VITYNGFKPNEMRVTKHRRRKADQGHSVVETRVYRPGDAFRFVYTVKCECGSKYSTRSGMSDRAFRSHEEHKAKKVGS
jgi:hypothetical protein